MSSPSTGAGKRVALDLTIGYVAVPKGSWIECERLASALVAAIEAEARAQALADVRAAVVKLSEGPNPSRHRLIDGDDLLAALDGLEPS